MINKKEFKKEIKLANTDTYLAKVFSKKVLRNNSAEESYLVALNVRDVNKKAHGRVVINSGDALYNYLYARDIPYADIRSHGKVVIKSGNQEYNYGFAIDVPDADIEAHYQAALKSGDQLYINLFQKYILKNRSSREKKSVTQARTLKLDKLTIERMGLKRTPAQTQPELQNNSDV